jgi:predicted ATPase/class 3 adenylate cyclase
VAVVFADVIGFTALSETHGPEEAYLVVTACLKLLDGIARQHGGAVDRYLGDRLMAVFGHPLPLRDVSAAAVEAALEMRERVADYNRELRLDPPLQLHIGVNTGPAVAGDIRGAAIREFHVLGDAVNVAARLKARSPLGEVYVGPETHADTHDGFDYRPLEPMQLKGKSTTVAIFALLGPKHARPSLIGSDQIRFSALVGREHELARLHERVERLAVRREGAIVILSGEEGTGKSRLLAELARAKEVHEVALLEARSPPAGREIPFQTFAYLVRQIANLGGTEDGAATRAALETALAERHAGVAPEVLDTLVGVLGASPRDPTQRLSSRAVTPALETVAACTARMLEALAQGRPLALVFDDLHRADAASLDALQALLPLAARLPILFLLVARPGAGELADRLLARARAEHAEWLEEVRLGPLDAAAANALIEALAGETDVSEEVRGLIAQRAAGNPGRIVLGVFMAPALRSESERTREGHERTSETERRRTTVVFADITGFTTLTERLGDEEAYSHVAAALAILDDVARKHGGTVDKYLGDCVLALFGVPVAIEDAPRAAVNAAIEMRDRIRQFSRERGLVLPLDVHSGINTGLGIAGDVGGVVLREFAVMGDSVEIADRLKDIAPAGEIQVGLETYRLTAHDFEYRVVEPIRLEGRSASVPTYELRSQRVRLHRRRLGMDREISSELIGRDAELNGLRDLVSRVARGMGGVAGLVGEAGLGKSRLIAELRPAAAEARIRWLEGRSLSIGQQLSYHPFADLFRVWAHVSDADAEEAIPAKVEAAVARLLPEERDEIFPFLGAVMGLRLPAPHAARLEGAPGEVLEKLIRRSVTSLVRRASEEQPLVLVFDDLHWADQSSIELLESLLRLAATHPILFVAVCRPGFAATSDRILAFARAHHRERMDEIHLEPLGHDASRLLIHNLFRQADIPHRVRTLIAEKAGGNPFYVEEVVRSLIDQGAVEAVADGFRATEKIHSAVIPDTVNEVIMARIDRLELRRRQLLQVASVIGRSFHQDVLLAIFPGKDELQADLEALCDAQFLVPWDRLQGIEYAFKHPLFQEVTYDSLVQLRREELHLRVGHAIEGVLTEKIPGYHAMLAYHFSLGRDLERSEEFLFRAGDEAARSAASNEALQFFQQASKLYLQLHGEGGDPTKRARLEKSLALALYRRGRLIESVEHFDVALRLLHEWVPQNTVARYGRFAANMLSLLAHVYLWGRTRERRPATDLQREIIDVMFRRGVAQTTSDSTRMVFDVMAALRKVVRLDPRTVPESGGRYAGAVAIFSYGGLSFALGSRFLEMAKNLVGEQDDLYLYYRVVNFVHHFLAGDWSSGHEIDDHLIERNLREGRLWEVTTYLGLRSEQLLRRGEFAEARERMARISEIWEGYEYDLAKTNHYWLPTCLLLEQRRLPEATDAAETYYQEIPEDLLHVLALGSKGRAQCLAGDLAGAENSLTKGARMVADAGQVPPFHLSCFRGARLALDLVLLEEALTSGDRAKRREARRRAARSQRGALRIAAKVAYRQPEIFRLAGRRAWLNGKADEAVRWWQRSLEIADRLGTRPERARTQQEIGLNLSTGPNSAGEIAGRSASEHLREAERSFRALGLEWDLARLEPSHP